MKFSTFIIIALLALIAYALLRPAPSPSALQDLIRLAQQLMPPAKAGDQQSQPAPEEQPPAPKADLPGNEKPSSAQPQLTWDPFAKDENATQKQYSGWVREHLERDCLLVRSGTKLDGGSGEEIVLIAYPGAAGTPLDTQIEFSAYSAGAVTYENDKETKTLTVLVYSSPVDPKDKLGTQGKPPTQPSETKQDSQAAKPGSWMWDKKSPLDRGPYNRR